MFKLIALCIAVAVAALLGLAATKPDTFSIRRATVIKAPPEKIFALINDFHSWPTWSPWEKLDPAMQRTYSGTASGKGTVYAWEGTGKVGAGRMEIIDTAVPSRITIQLDFIKPFEGHNIAEFTLETKGATTDVTWVMRGPNTFISKVMGIFFNMDSLIGKDFEMGLANMKAAAEK